MKNYIKIIVLFISTMLITSCSDEYFDVNTPANAIPEADVPLSDLMATTAKYTGYLPYYTESSRFGHYSQNTASKNGGAGEESVDQHYETSVSGVWTTFYLHILPQSRLMETKATEASAMHYRGMAKMMRAIGLSYVADAFGDAPYSEASPDVFKPAFDSQQDLYTAVSALLNDAIADLSATDTSGFVPAGDDIFYQGDMSKWIKAAHTFMARNAIHLTKAGASSAGSSAINHLNMGFTSNDDNLQLVFNSREKNPWHKSVVLTEATSNNYTMASDQFIDYMDGTSFPFNTVTMDPRLPIYIDNGSAAYYRGITNGDGQVLGDNAYFNPAYITFDLPLPIITYAEALFIKAEAEFLVNGGNATSTGTNAAAYQAYQDGITASMDAVGVSTVDKAAYLADTSIALGMGALELKHIMKEKFIANWLNPETFSDERRYDFSQDVFVDLDFPTNVNPDNGGQWVRRSIYPSSESERNPVNTAAAEQPITTPVWWDL